MAQLAGDEKNTSPDPGPNGVIPDMNGLIWVNDNSPEGGHFEFQTSTGASAPGGLPVGGWPAGVTAPVFGSAAGTAAAIAAAKAAGSQTPKSNPPSGGGTSTVLGIPTSLWDDILGGVTGLIGTKLATNAAGDATKAQLEAIAQATALQKAMYEQSRSDQLPWLKAGTGALQLLSQGLGLPNVDIPTLGASGTAGPAQTPKTGVDTSMFTVSPDGQTGSFTGTLNQLQQPPKPKPLALPQGFNPSAPGQASFTGSLRDMGAASGGANLAPVLMRTPSGGTVQVPENMVAEAEARGATRIN